MRCLECGAEMRLTSEPLTEKYRDEKITVNGVERWVCDACGNDQMTAEQAEKLARAQAKQYAQTQGFLSPADIKNLRKALGLTQKEFEKVLGVSSPTASRWETGTMQPSATANRLMTLLRDCPEAARQSLEVAEVRPAAVAVALGSSPTRTVEARTATSTGSLSLCVEAAR